VDHPDSKTSREGPGTTPWPGNAHPIPHPHPIANGDGWGWIGDCGPIDCHPTAHSSHPRFFGYRALVACLTLFSLSQGPNSTPLGQVQMSLSGFVPPPCLPSPNERHLGGGGGGNYDKKGWGLLGFCWAACLARDRGQSPERVDKESSLVTLMQGHTRSGPQARLTTGQLPLCPAVSQLGTAIHGNLAHQNCKNPGFQRARHKRMGEQCCRPALPPLRLPCPMSLRELPGLQGKPSPPYTPFSGRGMSMPGWALLREVAVWERCWSNQMLLTIMAPVCGSKQ